MIGLPGLIGIAAVWGIGYALSAFLYSRGKLHRDRHRDMLAIGVLVLVTLAFYWPLFFTESWIPKGGGDLASFIYPTYAFAARWIKRGVIPLWNPRLYLGMPFAADNQSGLFYPINLLFFVFAPVWTYEVVELLAVLHVFMAGLFAYLFLRDLASFRIVCLQTNPHKQPHIGHIPALAGAVSYMFSDLFVVHPGNLNIIATAAWLPLALLCFRRALIRRSWGWSAWSGVVLGIAALAGHAQMLLYVSMSLVLYTFFELYSCRQEGWRPNLSRLAMLAVAGAVAIGLAALSLVPAYDMVHYTIRALMDYPEASDFSIPPAGLISILMPGFFGRGTGPFWGPWSRTEMGYIGVLPLMLAVVAIALSWRRHPLTRFWLLLGTFGLLTALGPYTALHGWTYALIPFFRQLRVPARAIFLFDFAVAALAASGLDLLLHPLSRHAHRLLASALRSFAWIGGVLALVGVPLLGYAVITSRMSVPADILSQHMTSLNSLIFFLLLFGAGMGCLILRSRRLVRPTLLGTLAISAIVFDLISLGAYVEVEPNDPLIGYRHDKALAFFRADPEAFRVETTNEIHGSWAPDWALIHEMDDLNGIWNPLRLGAYDVLSWVGIGRDDPFYRLYNVKYLITSRTAPVPAFFEPAFDDGGPVIYHNTRALPRAFMVYEVLFADGDISALGMARSPDFDPATQIVLKRGTSVPSLENRSEVANSVQIIGRGPNHIDFEIITTAEGYLFVSEMWMPGWLAFVDGEKQEVLQANYTFRAVYVPSGNHKIHMVYRPGSWFLGLAVSLTMLAGLLLWGGWTLAQTRRHMPQHYSSERGT